MIDPAEKYFPKSSLKDRGWTEAGIKRFLGAPDKTKANPMYRSAGAPMQLFLRSRVEEIESSAAWIDWETKSKKRSATVASAAEVRRAKTIAYVESLQIVVPKMSPDRLVETAVSHYNSLWSDRGREKCASSNSDSDFLNRISVNYLRHELSCYEQELSRIFGQTGADEARLLLRENILDAIGRVYPHLAGECNRQFEAAQKKLVA